MADAGGEFAAIQSFTYAVFCAPTSFFDFASLRHAVRLTCFSAASDWPVVDASPTCAGGEAGCDTAGCSAEASSPKLMTAVMARRITDEG